MQDTLLKGALVVDKLEKKIDKAEDIPVTDVVPRVMLILMQQSILKIVGSQGKCQVIFPKSFCSLNCEQDAVNHPYGNDKGIGETPIPHVEFQGCGFVP